MPKKSRLALRILEKLAPHANISSAGIDNFAVRAYNNKRYITFVILNDEVIFLPPKSKISKEDIVSAGVDLVRRSGEKGLNARNLAAALGDIHKLPVNGGTAEIGDMQGFRALLRLS